LIKANSRLTAKSAFKRRIKEGALKFMKNYRVFKKRLNMTISASQKKQVKQKIKNILELDTRISEKRGEMFAGDTSLFLISLDGKKATLSTTIV
jgi:hypothetical protein